MDPGAGSITSLIQSLNTPLVAAGPHPAENVQSWILTRASGANVEVFVYFHLTESNQAVMYRWDGGPVPGSSQEQVVEEAMGFCESMGFMMDNLNFGQLPPDKRGELVQTLPPFLADLSALKQGEDLDELALSINKKVVDPVAEFARARQAAAESGQPTANDFSEPGVEAEFDPAILMGDGPAAGDGGMQVEITEIEGLELMPEPVRTPAPPTNTRQKSSVVELELDDDDEPPLIVGAAVTPSAPAKPAPAKPAPSKVAPPPAAPVRGRERTPPGDIDVFDEAPAKAAAPASAVKPAPTNTRPPPPPVAAVVVEEEFSVDDLLADVEISKPAATNGAAKEKSPAPSPSALDLDVSSALDDILDGVESSKGSPEASKPPAKPASRPTPMPAKPADEIGIDLDLDRSLENSISSPDEAMVALEALGVQDDLGGLPSLDEPPPMPPPAASKPAPPAVRPAVEAAWAEGTSAKANGTNGTKSNGAGALPARLDISTDDLARLLSML